MKKMQVDVVEVAKHLDGDVYTGNMKVQRIVGVMGRVGDSAKRDLFAGDMVVSQEGFGIMGSVSAEAAARMKSDEARNSGNTRPERH